MCDVSTVGDKVAGCSGRYGRTDDAVEALRAVLADCDLSANFGKLYDCTGDSDYVICDCFDGRERLVGWIEVSTFNGDYDFTYHAC